MCARCGKHFVGTSAVGNKGLVHEIRVEGRDRVVPWFRMLGGADPKVRALARSAPPASQNANLALLVEGPPISLEARHAKVRREGYVK